MKTYNVVTIFPDMFNEPFKSGVLAKAIEKGLISVNAVNMRDYAEDKHKMTDDYQYGGGAGLLMKPEPIVKAVEAIKANAETKVILLDPRGKTFNQQHAEELAKLDNITFICGRYEGVDERVRELVVDEEYSLGDYILTGGEFASMIMIDAIARLTDGVLGDETSIQEESFTTGMLEYPHYTRPAEFRGLTVPDVLLSGNHADINAWRAKQSFEITKRCRPDLVDFEQLDAEQKLQIAESQKQGLGKQLKLNVALMHYPMSDKQGNTVATAITNLDLHDISRSCRTYGVEKYYVITPVQAQREIAGRVIEHWMKGFGSTYNPNRMDAFSRTEILESYLMAVQDIERRHKQKPLIVLTTARPKVATITAKQLGVIAEDRPVFVLFGTGWGFKDEVYDIVDYVLEPIEGASDFNHLSVRSAVAILLDRITEI